jgi:hypothetical protein
VVRLLHFHIMSALQTFMLVVDNDKDEAKSIATSVAQGKYRPIMPPRTRISDIILTALQIQTWKARRPL